MNHQFQSFLNGCVQNYLENIDKKNSNKNTGSTNITNNVLNQLKSMNHIEKSESINLSIWSDSHQEAQDPFSYESVYSKNMRILDFSPEWDYTSGGAKLLVCFKPDLK
jgi:hypothetical protein